MARTGLKTLLFLFVALFLTPCSYAWTVLESDAFALRLNSYLRQDFVTFKNVVSLDTHNPDDHTAYYGIDYSLSLLSEFKKQDASFFVKLERNGPYDYNAPLFVHNTLMTTGGVVEKYQDDELLPEVEEFWLDAPLAKPYRLKAGLYTYEVGYGFALNGSYENYGFTLYRPADFCDWRFYYCRPDINHKTHLGPRIRQDEEQGIKYENGVANFLATDAKFKWGDNFIWPYVGVLADNTSPGKRDNTFSAPVKEDVLGTAGLAFSLKTGSLNWSLELARNFGRGRSESEESKDVEHTGYFTYGAVDYSAGKFKHFFKFLLASGNRLNPDMALNQDATLTSGKNRSFSYFSPFNRNLADSISSCNCDMLPVVAMGGGWGLNYGIPRPGSFSPGDFENLIMPSLGTDFSLSEKTTLSIYAYYLRSFSPGVGTLNGAGRFLSPDLGYELDLFIDHKLNDHVTLGLLGGYFFPGRFYREERDDTAGSLFTPFLRGDGKANSAYQLELSLTLEF